MPGCTSRFVFRCVGRLVTFVSLVSQRASWCVRDACSFLVSIVVFGVPIVFFSGFAVFMFRIVYFVRAQHAVCKVHRCIQ